MPSVVKIDPRRKLVISTFHGDVSGEDLLRHRTAIASDSAFSSSFADLVDFSGVTMPNINLSALRDLASQGSLFDPESAHIIVVPDESAYKMAVAYQQMTLQTRLNLYIVRTMPEAWEVLKRLGHPI